MLSMREIKFRSWYKTDKEMSVAWTLKDLSESEPFTMVGKEEDYIQLQYTGLKDAKGTDIYEGDLVKVDSFEPSVYEVVYDRGGFCMRNSPDDMYYPDGKYLEEGVVVGNIYQNKELLDNA